MNGSGRVERSTPSSTSTRSCAIPRVRPGSRRGSPMTTACTSTMPATPRRPMPFRSTCSGDLVQANWRDFPMARTTAVQAQAERFALALSYPQWQGSGRSANLRRGAAAAARVCGEFAPLEVVPSSGDGEARGGINRWTAILEQFHSAREILAAKQPNRLLTAGGDCACDVAVIDYLHGRYPDLFVVWIDAH